MKPQTLSPELLRKIDAYWRAANYLSVGQIYPFFKIILMEYVFTLIVLAS